MLTKRIAVANIKSEIEKANNKDRIKSRSAVETAVLWEISPLARGRFFLEKCPP